MTKPGKWGRLVRGSTLILHPDGTGSLGDRRLSEAETRQIFGGPVVDGVKASAKDPPRTGTFTVTAVDRAAGVVTVSALKVPPADAPLAVDKSVRRPLEEPVRLVILGPPRTKKNHGRVIKRGRRTFHVPSEAQVAWADEAVRQLARQSAAYPRTTVTRRRKDKRTGAMYDEERRVILTSPVNLCASIYRDADRGDAVGYYQAIADALEAAAVVENDKLIVSWNGSRLLIDRDRPRVEIVLTPLAAVGLGAR